MAMLAGMVTGVPGWQLDLMRDREDSRIWAEQNAPDQYEKQMKEASGLITGVVRMLSDSQAQLERDVLKVLNGTPMHDYICSYIDDLEAIRIGLKATAEKYERGER